MSSNEKWNHGVFGIVGCAGGIAAFSSVAWLGLSEFTMAADNPAEPPAAASGLEEVVVTARRTSESLQTTPIAITALSAEQISAQGMTNSNDVAAVSPNVELFQGGGGGGKSVTAFVRGVGQFDFVPASDPGVGFYIDDVYQGTLFGSIFDLTDVNQIEVLRGPQGTLFGKDNEGGAIRIFTPQPTGDGSGYFDAGYGSYHREQFKGAADFAIIPDSLFVRVSGGSNSYDGYINRVDYVCSHPNPAESGTLPRLAPESQGGNCITGHMGGDSTKTGRIKIRWIASDTLEANFSADVTDDQGEPNAEVLIAAVEGPQTGFTTVGGVPYDGRFVGPRYTNYVSYTDPVTGKVFPAVSNVFSYGASGKIDWNPAGDLHVKNILAYRTYNGEFTEVTSDAPIHLNDNYYKPYHRQITDELSVDGKVDALNWIAGLYYYRAYTELNGDIFLPEVVTPTGPLEFYGTDPVRDDDKSAFVHVDYHFTEKLSADAGLRYSKLTKEYTFDREVPTPYGQPQQYLPGFTGPLEEDSPASNVDYRAAIQYQWIPELMTYAQVSTGFKGPGVNPRPNTVADIKPFSKEKLRSYEIGLKSQWLDNKVRLNVAGYFSDYTDLQLQVSIGGTDGVAPGNYETNTGRVYISGVEAELEAEPITALLLSGTVGTIKYDIRDLGLAAGAPGAPAYGDKGIDAPSLKYSLGAQYGIGLGAVGKLTPRLDFHYQSEMFTDASNTALGMVPSYGVASAHLIYDSPDKKWQASAEVKNLTNRYYFTSKFNLLAQAGFVVGTPAPPREFFFDVRRSF